jgi:hypothetical protein
MIKKEHLGIAISMITGVGLLFVIVTFVIAQLFTFFNTGAQNESLLHLAYLEEPEHTPYFDTLLTENVIGRRLEAFNKSQIKADYSNAWYLLNKSQNKEALPQTEHFFIQKSFQKINQVANKSPHKEVFIERNDLEHSLNFYLFSIDGQVVSFTDSNVLIKERILSPDRKQIIHNQTYRKNYDVVMVLNDGNWRVRHIVPTGVNDNINVKPFPKKDNFSMVSVQGKKFVLEGQEFVPRGVNYYPAENVWLEMWKNFNGKVIKKDMELIKDLGANTVRIFIPFKEFGKGNVKISELEKVDTVLYHAKENNLKVIVTLFDFIHDYSLENWSKSDRQLERFLKRYKNNETIFAWDIKNEANLDYADHGEEFVEDWITFMLQRAKKYDPNHLITLGWNKPEVADRFSNVVDFVSFHYYEDPIHLGKKIDDLQAKIGEKPLLLEEFGMSSYHSIFYQQSKDEIDQYNYIANTRKILQEKGDIGYLVWTLHDFKEIPNYVVGKGFFAKKVQRDFGLYNRKGATKPAAELIKAEANLNEKNQFRVGKYLKPSYLALFLILTLIFTHFFWWSKFIRLKNAYLPKLKAFFFPKSSVKKLEEIKNNDDSNQNIKYWNF